MLRLYPGIHTVTLDRSVQFLIRHVIERLPHNGGIADETKFSGNGYGCIDMIAGNHDRPDTGLPAFFHGSLYFRTYRVDHTREPYKGQILLQCGIGDIRRQGSIFPAGAGQYPQRLIRHGLVLGHDALTVFIRHGTDPLLRKHTGAVSQHFIRGTFGKLHYALRAGMQGRHHFPHGIKRSLRHARKVCFERIFGEPLSCGKVYEGTFRRLALCLAGSIQLRIGTKSHASGQQGFVRSPGFYYSHFVLSQCTGLIRADDLSTAQSFNGGKAANDGIAFGHGGNADRQHNGHYSGQSLGNSGYC